MTGLDVHRLSPADCTAALRSYPRRFRSALTDLGDERPDDVAHRAGPDGRSAVEITDHVARSVALLAQALQRVLVEDEPVLLAAVVDDSAREWQIPGNDPVESVLDFLSRECDSLATAVEHVDADSWTRRGSITGGGSVTALDVVREAVRTGAEGLRATEAAMATARRSR